MLIMSCTKMNKPRCWMCGKDIEGNEHFFLVRRRVICQECMKNLMLGERMKIYESIGCLILLIGCILILRS